MNIGIKMSDCKFYIDKDARTVVCVIPKTVVRNDGKHYTCDAFLDFIRDNFREGKIDMAYSLNYDAQKQLRMPSTFMGKAVCAPEDEWNEDLGKLIAYSRAKDKFCRSFFKRANIFVNTIDITLNRCMETLNDYGTKLGAKKDAIDARINSMIS